MREVFFLCRIVLQNVCNNYYVVRNVGVTIVVIAVVYAVIAEVLVVDVRAVVTVVVVCGGCVAVILHVHIHAVVTVVVRGVCSVAAVAIIGVSIAVIGH